MGVARLLAAATREDILAWLGETMAKAPGLLFPKPGEHAGFSCERSRGPMEKFERGVSMQA